VKTEEHLNVCFNKIKKIIGSFLGVAVIVTMIFFSTNNAMSGSDTSLASLVGMNSANAECYGSLELDCPMWNVTVTIGSLTAFTCATGGKYKCQMPSF
jgi:hypothetical protein